MTNQSSIKVCFAALAFLFFSAVSGFVNRVPCVSSPLRLFGSVQDAEVIRREKKYIVVTGGVISGIGKGRQLLLSSIDFNLRKVSRKESEKSDKKRRYIEEVIALMMKLIIKRKLVSAHLIIIEFYVKSNEYSGYIFAAYTYYT